MLGIALDIVFGLLGATAVVAGWRVFTTHSMVRSAFLLLLSFVATAGMMLLLAAPYLGVATLFMMAVEMLAMAVFMVMFMMNPAGLNPMSMVHQHRFSLIAGIVTFVGLAAAVLLGDFPTNPVAAGRPVIHDLGIELLGDSMLIFESAGVTLLAAMIGVVVLSARSGRYGVSDFGSAPPALVPEAQAAGSEVDESPAQRRRQRRQKKRSHEPEDEPVVQLELELEPPAQSATETFHLHHDAQHDEGQALAAKAVEHADSNGATAIIGSPATDHDHHAASSAVVTDAAADAEPAAEPAHDPPRPPAVADRPAEPDHDAAGPQPQPMPASEPDPGSTADPDALAPPTTKKEDLP